MRHADVACAQSLDIKLLTTLHQGDSGIRLNYTPFSGTRFDCMSRRIHEMDKSNLILNGTCCSLIHSLEHIELHNMERQD